MWGRNRSGEDYQRITDAPPIRFDYNRLKWPEGWKLVEAKAKERKIRIDWDRFNETIGNGDAGIVEALVGRYFPGAVSVLFIGVAQEKARVPRTVRKAFGDGGTIPWIDYSSANVNFYYFYCLDEDFGPFFIKFCSYFPYTDEARDRETLRDILAVGDPRLWGWLLVLSPSATMKMLHCLSGVVESLPAKGRWLRSTNGNGNGSHG